MSILDTVTSFHEATSPSSVVASYQAPQVEWDPPEGLQETSRMFAFFLALLWVVWVLAQFAIPKKRSMMASGGIGAGRFVAAAACIVILLDITLVPTIINWILEGLWWVASLLNIV